MDDLRRASLEKLIRMAFEHGLCSDYRMTPCEVELRSGDQTISLDPEEARLYLRGLVRGYRYSKRTAVRLPLRRVA